MGMKGILVLAFLVLAGCASTGPNMLAPQADGTYLITLTEGNQFLPGAGTVPVNASVVFQSKGTHDVAISGPESATSGPVGGLKSGQSWSFTFTKPGTYDIVCHYHESVGMRMRLTVA